MSDYSGSNMDHLTCVRVPRTLGNGPIIEMVYWLQDNVKHRYFVPVNKETIYFHEPQDAVAFKLKFGL